MSAPSSRPPTPPVIISAEEISEKLLQQDGTEKTAEGSLGDSEREEKLVAIREASKRKDRERLAELAVEEGGLLEDELRREGWPVLLGFDPDEVLQDPNRVRWEDLPKHRDEEQVRLDVERAFVHYPTNVSPMAEKQLRKQLQELITEVLRRHPMLNYFQGFHDISQLLLLALSPTLAAPATEYLSLTYLRDFMLPTLYPALVHLQLIPPLLQRADPQLASVLQGIKPFFALSATLTMYAHEVRSYTHATRIFDAVLARGTAFSVYLFVGVLQARKAEVLELAEEVGDAGGGEDVLGAVLGRWKGEKVDLEQWIAGAEELWKKAPLESLETFGSVGKNSVLRARATGIEEGRRLFNEQDREVKRQKMLMEWKKRATVVWQDRRVQGAVAVGVLAVALGFWGVRAGRNDGLGMDVWRILARARR